LKRRKIVCEVYCLSLISPLSVTALVESVNRTHTIISVEEGSAEAGFGSEVIAQLMERGVALSRVKRLGATGIIPAAGPLETNVLPNAKVIFEAIKELCVS